jgi:hypothetical protein
MNARRASTSTAVVNRSGSIASVIVLRRPVPHLPLALLCQAGAIVGAFLCSYLLYGRIAGDSAALDWSLLVGAGTFVTLFAQLRLIDDLDDLERDHPIGQWTAARRSALRARLLASLAACVTLIAILNFGKWHALMVAAAATALAFAAPFGFKRLFPRSLAVGSLLFEGAPFLILVYCYFFWRDAGGPELPFAAAACVSGLFWAGYEFWKFSRKVHTNAMQPYFLAPQGIRAALNAFLVLVLVANLALAQFAQLLHAYRTYAIALPLVWLVWLNATWRVAASEQSDTRRPLWAGLTFVGALEIGLLVELLPLFGSK